MANSPAKPAARESFSSRLGFLLVSAGCAVGIGNVWRFPFVTGKNGGAVFVLFYIVFLIIMGIPTLSMELAVGRASRRSAVDAYRALEPSGSKWHIHGYFCFAGCYLLMMYYTTVSGWMLAYIFKFLKGDFARGMGQAQVQAVYDGMTASPGASILWMAIVVLLGYLCVSFGVQKGLEKISKYMMIALFLLITVLAVHSCFLPGAGRGVSFYLKPDFHRAAEAGMFTIVTEAMNQAFFTLSSASPPWKSSEAICRRTSPFPASPSALPAWTRSSPFSPDLLSSRPASHLAYSPTPARRSSSSPCRTSSPIWQEAVSGEPCSSCS